MFIPLLHTARLWTRQSNPFVSPNPPSSAPGSPSDPVTTDIIIGFGVAGAIFVLLLIVLSIREVRRRRKEKERRRRRMAGLPVPVRFLRLVCWPPLTLQ